MKPGDVLVILSKFVNEEPVRERDKVMIGMLSTR
jgi:hypothetical protein